MWRPPQLWPSALSLPFNFPQPSPLNLLKPKLHTISNSHRMFMWIRPLKVFSHFSHNLEQHTPCGYPVSPLVKCAAWEFFPQRIMMGFLEAMLMDPQSCVWFLLDNAVVSSGYCQTQCPHLPHWRHHYSFAQLAHHSSTLGPLLPASHHWQLALSLWSMAQWYTLRSTIQEARNVLWSIGLMLGQHHMTSRLPKHLGAIVT